MAAATLIVGGSLNLADTFRLYGNQESILSGPIPAVAQRINDGKAVIGVRALHLAWVDSDIQIYGGFFLSEREFVTFLTWPSDRAVIEVLEQNDIGWVLVNPDPALETEYNEAWIRPAYGLKVRHVEELRRSRNFCLEMERGGYLLYRLGRCH